MSQMLLIELNLLNPGFNSFICSSIQSFSLYASGCPLLWCFIPLLVSTVKWRKNKLKFSPVTLLTDSETWAFPSNNSLLFKSQWFSWHGPLELNCSGIYTEPEAIKPTLSEHSTHELDTTAGLEQRNQYQRW